MKSFPIHAERLPDIFKSDSSIIDIGKMLNTTHHDGDPLWDQMPRNERQLTGLLGQVRNNAGMVMLARFIDNTLQRAQITLFFADHTSDNLLRIRDAAYDFFKQHSMKTENGEFKLAGGRIGMEIALNEEMKRSMWSWITLVFVAIFIMLFLVVSIVCSRCNACDSVNFIQPGCVSYMAIAGIGLSANTLPCAAVGVGVGVDFAIYLYSRCVEEFPNHNDWRETIMAAVRTAGGGVVFTGITLILPILTWYFISELKFQAQMGFFLSMLLFINMLAAFTLHPLLIITIKPSFMKRKLREKKTLRSQNKETSHKEYSVGALT